MLKSFIQYIVGLSAPNIQDIGGVSYSDKQLHRINPIPYANEIQLNTLSSLIDYIKSGVDTFSGKMIIHVQSPVRVAMYSALDTERKREEIVTVNAQIPSFEFGRFMDHESFCIGVQCALFEADGGAWKIDAVSSIHEYLIRNLEGFDNIIVIS